MKIFLLVPQNQNLLGSIMLKINYRRGCTFNAGCNFCLLEIINYFKNVSVYERYVKISLSYLARRRKETRALCWNKRQITKTCKRFLAFITIHLLHCVIIRVFAVYQIVYLLRVLKEICFCVRLNYRRKCALNLLL